MVFLDFRLPTSRALLAAALAATAFGSPSLAAPQNRPGDVLIQVPGNSAAPATRENDAPRGPATTRTREAPPPDREMAFDFSAGTLRAVGTITRGTATRFADEVRRHGGAIKVVSLHSRGGSVRDAIEMGKLIRERKFVTEVENGHTCVSSCPLVFAGGVTRRAGARVTIGVHQVSSAAGEYSHEDGMASAQQVTAVTEAYLRDMGVDLDVWLHAMATPKETLYIFTPKELLELKLATEASSEQVEKANARVDQPVSMVPGASAPARGAAGSAASRSVPNGGASVTRSGRDGFQP